MPLTPGVHHLLTSGPSVVAPPLLVHVALRCAAQHAHVHLSRPLLALVWVCTLPLYWYLRATYTHLRRVRAARRLGAKLVPAVSGECPAPRRGRRLTSWTGRLPGNVDLLWSNYFARDLYLGDGFAAAIDAYGTTFSNSIMGDYRVISANPDTMKQILATEFSSFEKVRRRRLVRRAAALSGGRAPSSTSTCTVA